LPRDHRGGDEEVGGLSEQEELDVLRVESFSESDRGLFTDFEEFAFISSNEEGRFSTSMLFCFRRDSRRAMWSSRARVLKGKVGLAASKK